MLITRQKMDTIYKKVYWKMSLTVSKSLIPFPSRKEERKEGRSNTAQEKISKEKHMELQIRLCHVGSRVQVICEKVS